MAKFQKRPPVDCSHVHAPLEALKTVGRAKGIEPSLSAWEAELISYVALLVARGKTILEMVAAIQEEGIDWVCNVDPHLLD